MTSGVEAELLSLRTERIRPENPPAVFNQRKGFTQPFRSVPSTVKRVSRKL
jgi:hypothetical protein